MKAKTTTELSDMNETVEDITGYIALMSDGECIEDLHRLTS